jgi:O-antigen/teichoic acid export membrane protein
VKTSPLRLALYAVGLLLAAAALFQAAAGCAAAALWLGGLAAVLLLGLLFERWRYRGLAGAKPGPGWEETGERFVDPETGKRVTVWFHPETGERRYVAG